MKSLVLLLLVAVAAHGAERGEEHIREMERMKQAAMALMEDIVPHAPVSDEMLKISNGKNRALWGAIFGDAQIGALVAVQSDADKPGSDAHLCLLLWQDGWKFAQWAGTVSSFLNFCGPSEWDWGIKRRVPDRVYYVINTFDLNGISRREHLSWLCDPHTHSLIPTGWPKDAQASVSGTTITFQRCEKSGYAPIIREIDQFDGSLGKNIATYSETYVEGHLLRLTVSLPDTATDKRVTWRIWKLSSKYEIGHDRYSLCRDLGDGKMGDFHEDATLDIQTKDWSEYRAIRFLIWRLTGLSTAAQNGRWDEDFLREEDKGRDMGIHKPSKAVVEGIPEAVKAFTWPESQAETEP